MTTQVSRTLEMDHAVDPAKLIWDDVGDLIKKIDVTGKDVFLVGYKRTGDDKTKGGIILPQGTRDEDDIQGIAFLVVKKGPFVAEVEDTGRFGYVEAYGTAVPRRLDIGDWVMADSRYAFSFLLRKRQCKLLQAEYIMGFIPRPDVVL